MALKSLHKSSKIAIRLGSAAAIALALGLAAPGAAFAKGGNNGNGGGNGNGKGAERSAERGQGAARGQGGSRATGQGATTVSPKGGGNRIWIYDADGNRVRAEGKPGKGHKPHGQKVRSAGKKNGAVKENNGSLRSAMGALNAANASENALANASPNSRVGRIAAYRDAVLDGREAEGELADARDLLDSLEEPDRTTEEIRGDLRGVRRDILGTTAEVRRLRRELEEAGGSDPDIEAELADARQDLRGLVGERREILDELDDARTYETAKSEVERLEGVVEMSEEDALAALEAAANKPLTDEVIAEVDRLLGLDEEEIVEEVIVEEETAS